MYHTISGGPETLHDKYVSTLKAGGVVQEANPSVRTSDMSASGYTIPDPHYVELLEKRKDAGTSFGLIMFIILLLIIAVPAGYLYVYMPDTFNTIYETILLMLGNFLT
jgi:hypothetical protein